MRRALPWILLIVVVLGVGLSIAWRFRPRIEQVDFNREALRMEVLNGCGEARLARAVADELQTRGYNVYSTGDAQRRTEKTTVVDLRDPTGAAAGLVARALGVEAQSRIWDIPLAAAVGPLVAVEVDSSRYLELRLVLGSDWQRFFPQVRPLR